MAKNILSENETGTKIRQAILTVVTYIKNTPDELLPRYAEGNNNYVSNPNSKRSREKRWRKALSKRLSLVN